MTTIVRLGLENADVDPNAWALIASRVAAWSRAEAIELRDACMLLPFAQLLPEARRAFAALGGWPPCIETTHTLAGALGPPTPPQSGQITFDLTTDLLAATSLLQAQPWGLAWARRDRQGFAQSAKMFVGTAHRLARAAFALLPQARGSYWLLAREVLTPLSGPGATERMLARMALEWASLAPAPATDRLFTMQAPSAWIVVQAGGIDAMVSSLTAAANAPCLWLDTDASVDRPFAAVASSALPSFAVCSGFEDEAQRAAAHVLEHLGRGEVPVALIAQDRVLVRRVRALLERARPRVLDETGWKLSTTRAAAQVMGLLRAARGDANSDAVLDWLKGCESWADAHAAGALSLLEAACRNGRLMRSSAISAAQLEPAAARLWEAASALLEGLCTPPRQALPAWLGALGKALEQCAALEPIQADDAGRQLLAALRLAPPAAGATPWTLEAAFSTMSLEEFATWVDDVLEEATFLPAPGFSGPAQVIITPVARAMLRPFSAVVFAGADGKRLGAPSAPTDLLGDVQCAALGVATSRVRRETELIGFVHVLAAPRVTFLRRREDNGEPLADSPLIERLGLALAACGRAMTPSRDPRLERRVGATPIGMPAPSAPALLPRRLSASACEDLRACPYKFFARNLLHLSKVDELEGEVEKRTYGKWLHDVLQRFHAERPQAATFEAEVKRLLEVAFERQALLGVNDADFLPFVASCRSLAPRYVRWLHERDLRGARWSRGEEALTLEPLAWGGIELRGIVDRIDDIRIDSVPALEILDYKTGSATGLKERLKLPLEDTQLGVYAALVRSQSELPLKAIYLTLDGSKAPEEIEHLHVEADAAKLVQGLGHDLRRLREGAGMPALGEGAACDYCEARGLCRRDHWSETLQPQAPE